LVDIDGIREENEGELDHLTDEEVKEMFELGKYEALWDHTHDAYDQFEELADAFLIFVDAAKTALNCIRQMQDVEQPSQLSWNAGLARRKLEAALAYIGGE